MRNLVLAAYFVALLAIGWTQWAVAADCVRTPRLVSDRVVDCSSVESIIAAITRAEMTPQQRAEAVYEFVRQYRWHWAPAREGDRRDDFEYGIVYDPIKLLNVYGYGYCFQTAPLLEALYEAAGLEARGCGIGGHSIAEVYYDGQYHFYDADQHGFFRLLDGHTVASLAQLERDPIRLVLNQPNPSNPFFPATKNPRVPYESKVIVAGYFGCLPNHYTRYSKVDVGHRMDISLAPGMRYIRYFQPRGQWCYNYKDLADDMKIGFIDPEIGPKDPFTPKTYGNGTLLWQPDLVKDSNEYRAGVWQDENIAQDEQGLLPAAAGKPAWAIFRVRLPYVIVGWPGSWTENKPVGAAVVSAAFPACQTKDARAISVSVDGGRTWKVAWKGEAPAAARPVVDLSQWVAGRYEYLLRFELLAQKSPGDCRLGQVAIQTNFQLNPATLPAVGEGQTKMHFSLGEETETMELTADLMTADGFLRDVNSIRDINYQPGRLTSRAGRPGEIVYELAPPRPGAVVSFTATAGCRRQPANLNYQDDIRIYYAENNPANWKLLANDDVPTYLKHWSYFLNGQAKCSPDVKRVFVKIALKTAANAAVQMIRLRMNWQPGQVTPPAAGKPAGLQLEQGVPIRGLHVEHGWTEGGVDKRFETVIKETQADYTIDAAKDVVNRFVLIEPVRAPSAQWRPDDPPIQPPSIGKPNLVDPKARGEMQSLCRLIDQDSTRYLPQAAASKSDWLAGGAREAIAMFKTTYPLADPPLGQTMLTRANRLLADLSPAATAPDDEEDYEPVVQAPPDRKPLTAADCNRIFVRLQATSDRPDRAILSAALVLLGDKRGIGPLAESLRSMLANVAQATAPHAVTNMFVDGAAVLLKTGDPLGRQVAQRIMASPNTYLKLNYLETLLGDPGLHGIGPNPTSSHEKSASQPAAIPADPPNLPEVLLVGLADPSRWVRLDVLRLCRGPGQPGGISSSPPVQHAIARVAKEDPVQFLREEAARMLK